ncbi:MAG TPA: glutamine synthetase [bacterium]|nr:glutamine synthetase [bacterium]
MTDRSEEVLRTIEKNHIEYLYLLFTDITGQTKKVTLPARLAESALAHGVWFDGSSIEGFARICESDMLLRPDPETFAILPWTREKGTGAQIICDIYLPDEKPFEGDPRGVLKRVIKKAESMGYRYYVGPEIEFFLIDRDTLPDCRPHDRKGYFDLGVQSRAVEICQATMKHMDEMGYSCETYHHEVSHGQHEIDLSYGEVLRVSDAVTAFKHALRTHASFRRFKVTFMPKPFMGVNGSGMHVHQSLWNKGGNLFFGKEDKYGISSLAYQFLAGQIRHARALSAIAAPTVNSYKRLVPGYEAPVYICWGRVNRSALIRIPMVTRSKAGEGARIELRCPDPSCNPYLAFACMLAAGLDGVQNKLKVPDPVEENVYDCSDERIRAMNISMLPSTLGESIEALEQNSVLSETLGERLMNHFSLAKRREWRYFLNQVTPWEVERYL